MAQYCFMARFGRSCRKIILKRETRFILKGKIKTRSYEQDGQKRYITEIYGDNMTMLGRREEGNDGGDIKTRDRASQPTQAPNPV